MQNYTNENGRSMVEMLGVLAVIGVLSIGGIQGYTYAMNKYRANGILNELNIASHQLATALLTKETAELELSLGNPYDLGRISSAEYTFNYGCGNGLSEEDCGIDETGYWMTISGIPDNICNQMLSMGEHMPYLAERELNGNIIANGATCAEENNEITFLFNSDGSGKLSEETGGNGDGNNNENGGNKDDEDDETPPVDCGSHGTWNKSLSKCVCDKGWSGTTCEKSITETCVYGNNSYGFTSHGMCSCMSGFGGLNCDQGSREACNNHGEWYPCGSSCLCDLGYSGIYCQNEMKTDNYCNNGVWNPGDYGANGYCQCHNGYAGKDCTLTQEEANAQYCNNSGVWKLSTNWEHHSYCVCNDEYWGTNCSKTNAKCSGHGSWRNDYYGATYCDCDSGWGGENCSIKNPCSGNGSWNSYKNSCNCYSGWSGENCSYYNCGSSCTSDGGYCGANCNVLCTHGVEFNSYEGACTCDAGWAGKSCDVLEKDYCIHGFWNPVGKYCVCENGWTGENCNIPFTN